MRACTPSRRLSTREAKAYERTSRNACENVRNGLSTCKYTVSCSLPTLPGVTKVASARWHIPGSCRESNQASKSAAAPLLVAAVPPKYGATSSKALYGQCLKKSSLLNHSSVKTEFARSADDKHRARAPADMRPRVAARPSVLALQNWPAISAGLPIAISTARRPAHGQR